MSMRHLLVFVLALFFLWTQAAGCDSSGSAQGTDAGALDAAGSQGDAASVAPDSGLDASSSLPDASTNSPTAEEARTWIEAYKAAHPGNGGKDWDINAKSPAEIAADPDAQRLLALCGSDQRPVIPLLAWEYGGSDHPWIHPEASALVYCVYVPVSPSTEHWRYDAGADHVTADVYLRFPEENPCASQVGADQVLACLGDPTNIEVLVDVASFRDGVEAGLSLSEASTDLVLLDPQGARVPLYSSP